MPRGSSPARQRQHIKPGAARRGTATRRATQVSARTATKNRARSGQVRTATRSSMRGTTPARSSSTLRSRRTVGGPTYAELYSQARRRNIRGRSSMTKAQLVRALAR